MFIAVDPGQNVGVASFGSDGSDGNRFVNDLSDFRIFLRNIYDVVKHSTENAKVHWIVEDFSLRQDRALEQTGSDMPASKCIGMVDLIDHMLENRSQLTMVPPSHLSTGLKLAGFKQYARRGIHAPDHIAAYAHGVKFLIDQGLRRHPIFDAD
jgi:hypothetical protein